MRLLLGHPVPTGNDLFLPYLIIDGLVCVLTALVLWSLVHLLRRQQKRLKWRAGSMLRYLFLPLLWEWGLPIALFLGIPALLGGVTWIGILLFVPDVGYWLLVMFCLLLLSGLIRCGLSFRQVRRKIAIA